MTRCIPYSDTKRSASVNENSVALAFVRYCMYGQQAEKHRIDSFLPPTKNARFVRIDRETRAYRRSGIIAYWHVSKSYKTSGGSLSRRARGYPKRAVSATFFRLAAVALAPRRPIGRA